MGCSYGTTSKQPTRNIPSHCEDRERASTKLECDYLEQFMKDSQGNNMDASKFNSINLCRNLLKENGVPVDELLTYGSHESCWEEFGIEHCETVDDSVPHLSIKGRLGEAEPCLINYTPKTFFGRIPHAQYALAMPINRNIEGASYTKDGVIRISYKSQKPYGHVFLERDFQNNTLHFKLREFDKVLVDRVIKLDSPLNLEDQKMVFVYQNKLRDYLIDHEDKKDQDKASSEKLKKQKELKEAKKALEESKRRSHLLDQLVNSE